MCRFQKLLCVAVCSLTCAACTWPGRHGRDECCDPDARLATYLDLLDRAKASGSNCETYYEEGHVVVDCQRLRNEIERLNLDFPRHVPTLMANAVLAYGSGERVKAQRYLDALFAVNPVHPEAAILRSRIAMEEGNTTFARRLLERQIKQSPDHAGLREAYAGVLYLLGRHDDARSALVAARSLGSPDWRLAYNLGLVEEATGNPNEAKRLYSESVAANPAWHPAESRLIGLEQALP